MTYPNDFINKVITGDCMEVLKQIPDNSIDTVITDPPYGLSDHSEQLVRKTLLKWLNGEEDYIPKTKGFMNKSWDAFVPPPAVWKEIFRVMKPGATILVFAGSRTYDLMTISLRLAGFEIKDTLMWLYGSGFPKATDISKQIDKKEGVEHPKNSPISKNIAMSGVNYTRNKMPVKSEKEKLWNGYKSHGLKPAYEPIIMAIKPNDGSYAENALKWGVAGLNIDESRIEYKNDEDKQLATSIRPNAPHHNPNIFASLKQTLRIERGNPQGRFPANVIIDEETAKMIDQQSGITKSHPDYRTNEVKPSTITFSNRRQPSLLNDAGGASRFVKNIKVDLLDFSMYNINKIVYLKEAICGTILENQKIGGMLDGVIKEAEKYTQSVEQFIFGNSKTENFQKDMKSIILTLIQQMIELKTYNVFLSTSIDYFTENCEQTIKLLMEWNTEDARNVDNIKHLIILGNELLELLEDIVRIVQKQNLKNGRKQIENTETNITNNIGQNISNRFFYCAKASRNEREFGLDNLPYKIGGGMKGTETQTLLTGSENIRNNLRKNHHPTVKPLKLIEYLCKLTKTPTGGIVLDPFAGSGTTGMACIITNRPFILIEKDPEYSLIAQKRIDAIKKLSQPELL